MTVAKKPLPKTRSKPDARFPQFFDVVSEALSDQRRITLRGDVDSGMLAHCSHSLNFLADRSNLPIEIELTSRGGSCDDGLGIYDKIRQIRGWGVEVNITVFGYAMSMAVPILQAATVRRAGRNATFLLHEVSYTSRGTHSTNKDFMESTEKLAQRLNNILAERSKLSVEQIEKLTERKDATISAEQAHEFGLVDVLI